MRNYAKIVKYAVSACSAERQARVEWLGGLAVMCTANFPNRKSRTCPAQCRALMVVDNSTSVGL